MVTDLAGPTYGRYIGYLDSGNCGNWTETTYNNVGSTVNAFGETLTPSGTQVQQCGVARAIACCTSPYRERFRGFTTATTTGAASGRALMTFLCASEVTGSHLCHLAEYARAASTVTPPASGAWVDYSGTTDQNGSSVVDTEQASSYMARYVGYLDSGNCGNWTETTYNNVGSTVNAFGETLTPTGTQVQQCGVARPAACCQ